MKLIVKTYKQAIEAAKNEALESFRFSIEDTKDSDWLIKNSSCQCNCGETAAVDATYFAPDDTQHYALVGYCEACGVDY